MKVWKESGWHCALKMVVFEGGNHGQCEGRVWRKMIREKKRD